MIKDCTQMEGKPPELLTKIEAMQDHSRELEGSIERLKEQLDPVCLPEMSAVAKDERPPSPPNSSVGSSIDRCTETLCRCIAMIDDLSNRSQV